MTRAEAKADDHIAAKASPIRIARKSKYHQSKRAAVAGDPFLNSDGVQPPDRSAVDAVFQGLGDGHLDDHWFRRHLRGLLFLPYLWGL